MAKGLQALGSQAIAHQGLHPRTKDKADRFIKMLLAEWAYAMLFEILDERTSLLPCYLGLDFGRRCHMTFCGISPQEWLQASSSLNDLVRKHT